MIVICKAVWLWLFFLKFGVTNAISPFIDCANFLLVAGSGEAESAIQDNLPEFCASFLAAYDSGDLVGALEEGQAGWKNWVKGFGKSTKRKVSWMGKSQTGFSPVTLVRLYFLHFFNWIFGLLWLSAFSVCQHSWNICYCDAWLPVHVILLFFFN